MRWQDYLDHLRQVLRCESFSQLSRLLGVSSSTLSRWVAGERPSCEEVIRIARLVGDDPVQLLVVTGYLTEQEARRAAPSIAEERLRYLARGLTQLTPEQYELVTRLVEELTDHAVHQG